MLAKVCSFSLLGIEAIILPQENAREAAVVEGIKVYPVETLLQVVSFLNQEVVIPPYSSDLTQVFQCNRRALF